MSAVTAVEQLVAERIGTANASWVVRTVLANLTPADVPAGVTDAIKAEGWNEGLQAGENFEAARWAGTGATPRPPLTVRNPYRQPVDNPYRPDPQPETGDE